ncbi:MAG: MgtC/SapB family protein [Methanobacteriota archaeon]
MYSIDTPLAVALLKLILAMICGSLLGLEREMKEKPAGLRTFMLITTGSCLFVIVGTYISESWTGASDPGRVAAQVVAGIGFLGAGTIIHSRGSVHGLTSAATIWVSAGIGIAIAVDLFLLAILVTFIILGMLVGLRAIELRIGTKGRARMKAKVLVKEMDALEKISEDIESLGEHIRIQQMKKYGDGMQIILMCQLTATEGVRLQNTIARLEGVESVDLEPA